MRVRRGSIAVFVAVVGLALSSAGMAGTQAGGAKVTTAKAAAAKAAKAARAARAAKLAAATRGAGDCPYSAQDASWMSQV
jgi:hypothetical protein